MSTDFISISQLILAVAWGTAMLIFLRRNKSNPKLWPRIFGIGAAIFMIILSVLGTLKPKPVSELMDYIISNFFWSLVVGVIAYFSGRILVRRFGSKY
jgi:quinol-cytochrome oxidoreductase complex cytochrome b subunit